MKKLLKNIAYFLYGLAPALSGKYSQAAVLMYHSVAVNDSFSAVAPAMFLKQMKYLAEHGFHVVSLSDLNRYLESGGLPEKTVAITFDDGCMDNYSAAFPILKKFGLPAAIFLSTSLINGYTDSRSGEKIMMLTDQEIKEMIAGGLITIASHCHNHKKLANLSGEEVEYELAESKKIIKETFGYEADFLAYPFGSFNQAVKLAAQKYYRLAFSVNPGTIGSRSDRFELKRNAIDSRTGFYQFKKIIKYGRI